MKTVPIINSSGAARGALGPPQASTPGGIAGGRVSSPVPSPSLVAFAVGAASCGPGSQDASATSNAGLSSGGGDSRPDGDLPVTPTARPSDHDLFGIGSGIGYLGGIQSSTFNVRAAPTSAGPMAVFPSTALLSPLAAPRPVLEVQAFTCLLMHMWLLVPGV
jgi:hypothetical protein